MTSPWNESLVRQRNRGSSLCRCGGSGMSARVGGGPVGKITSGTHGRKHDGMRYQVNFRPSSDRACVRVMTCRCRRIGYVTIR